MSSLLFFFITFFFFLTFFFVVTSFFAPFVFVIFFFFVFFFVTFFFIILHNTSFFSRKSAHPYLGLSYVSPRNAYLSDPANFQRSIDSSLYCRGRPRCSEELGTGMYSLREPLNTSTLRACRSSSGMRPGYNERWH